MSNVVVIGVPGQEGLWVADIGAGTLTALDATTSRTLRETNATGTAGAAVVKNVNFAVGITSTASVAAGFLDG